MAATVLEIANAFFTDSVFWPGACEALNHLADHQEIGPPTKVPLNECETETFLNIFLRWMQLDFAGVGLGLN